MISKENLKSNPNHIAESIVDLARMVEKESDADEVKKVWDCNKIWQHSGGSHQGNKQAPAQVLQSKRMGADKAQQHYQRTSK